MQIRANHRGQAMVVSAAERPYVSDSHTVEILEKRWLGRTKC